ncbi:Cytochrome P450 [Dillenia turbinata]|uniref:Cytochrome P450 n=1 Tax=Dillenia turbinata TaxID=194707 RepID=A0AAN8ZJJ0_9MAGN
MVPFFVSEETPLLVSILLFLTIIFLALKHKSSKVPPLPPGPRPWPIIGNLPSIDNKPHLSLTHLAQTYGPLISLRLGSQLIVVGSSPEAAAEILKTHDRLLSGRYVPHALYARRPDQSHTSFWTDCTDQWKFLRTLCRSELFGPKMIEAQSILREEKVQEMVEYLCSKEGQPVQISQVVFASMFNILGQVFFTRDFIGFNEGKESGSMSRLMRELSEFWASPNISDLYPILGGLDLQGLSRKSDVCVGKICGAWQNIIEKRRENKGINAERHKDFLDVLLDNEFSDDQINHLFLELFAAGSDTSTSTVVWAMAELIKNPESMDKIRKEVASHISQSAIKESDLAHLPHLQACFKETLRLHPPAPFLLPHRAIQDCHVWQGMLPMVIIGLRLRSGS